jgi:Phosphotransferase enzyme family
MREDGAPLAVVADHPAVRAWATLHGSESMPCAVDVLEDTKKTGAYRLHGLGPGGGCVIGKRASARVLEVERLVYQEVLTQLPLRSLHCHGFVEVGSSAWLFMEDADHGAVAPVADNRQWPQVAQWLGEVHGAAASTPAASRLPHREPNHYLEHLRAARTLITRNRDHPAFYDEDRAAAGHLLRQLDGVEARWSLIDDICRDSPCTLVHGDLQPKNLRLRVEDGKAVVLSFDWETAGWGVPAVDLASLVAHPDGSAFRAYVSSIGSSWPQMDAALVPTLARAGHVFRWLTAVWWAALGLDHAWIERSRWKLRGYRFDLEQAAAALRWVS